MCRESLRYGTGNMVIVHRSSMYTESTRKIHANSKDIHKQAAPGAQYIGGRKASTPGAWENDNAARQHKEGLAMRRGATMLVMLGALWLLPLLLTGCDGDGDSSRAFVLEECRLDDAGCRLQ